MKNILNFIKNPKLKMILILTFLLILYTGLCAISYATTASSDIANSVFRLHVIANSDSDTDQNLKYKFMGFSDTIEQALYNYEKLDKFCDNYIMSYMKEAKLKALTIEPVVAYIYAKQTEFKNIRIIFTGKLNNISNEKIKERLRESYV